MESEAEFRNNLEDPAKRKAAYEALMKEGYEMEAYNEFETNIGFGKAQMSSAPEAVVDTAAAASVGNVAQSTQAAPMETAAPRVAAPRQEPPEASGTTMPSDDARAQAEQRRRSAGRNLETNRMFEMSGGLPVLESDGAVDMPESRVTATNKMLSASGTALPSDDARAQANQRMTESFTAAGRKRQREAEQRAQIMGEPFRKPVGAPSAKPEDAEAATAANAPGESAAAGYQLRGATPYGVKMVDGEPVQQWLMPDGRVTTSRIDVENAEWQAQRGREAYRADEQRRRKLADVVETLWKEAEEAHKADREKNAKKHWDEYAALGGGREMRTVAAAMERGDDLASHMTRFDLQTMMDDAWERVGDMLTQEYYDDMRRANPNGTEEELRREAAKMARAMSDGQIYDYAVKQNTPKSTLEFFGRTVADANVVNSLTKGLARSRAGKTGDLAAYEQATAEYGKEHFWTQIGGTVLGMAVDPTTYVAGYFGGLGGKFATNVGSRIMASRIAGLGIEKGAHLWGSSLVGRLATRAAAGAGNYAAFEVLKEGESQWLHGGHMDEHGNNEGYSGEALLKAAGKGMLLGAVTGAIAPVLGNISDKVVKATKSTAGKMAVRGAELGVAKVAEGTIFAMPEWYENSKRKDGDPAKRGIMDIWNDNMAMVFGFTASHGVKSAPKVIASLRPVKPTAGRPLTAAERRHNRMSFEEKVRKALDPANLTNMTREDAHRMQEALRFSDDEREELRRAGYGELAELFAPTGDKKKSGEAKVQPDGMGIDFERAEPEVVAEKSRYEGTDGYEEMERLMDDKNVSQAVRAKAYYILTDHMLPMGTIADYTTKQTDGGRVTVNAVTADGEVVTSRSFANEKAAEGEISNIKRQAELNSIDVGERYANDAIGLVALDEVKELVGRKHKLPAEAIENVYEKQFKGEELSERERAIVEDVNSILDEVKEKYHSLTPEAMREDIGREYGVDVDAAIRKREERRSDEEKEAVAEYAKRLYEQAERQRKANAMFSEEYAEMSSEEKERRRRAWRMQVEGKLLGADPEAEVRNYEQGRETYERFEQGGPEAEAEFDAIEERAHMAYERFDEVFGTEAPERLWDFEHDPWGLASDAELTEDQREAVLDYINAKAALDGVLNASQDAAERKRQEVERAIERRTHKENHVIIPAVLKVNDRQVYIVKGRVEVFADGSGVDAIHSDEHVIVVDAETGEYEYVSPDQILRVDRIIDPEEEKRAALDAIEQEHREVEARTAGATAAPSTATVDWEDAHLGYDFEEPSKPQTPAGPPEVSQDSAESSRGYDEGLRYAKELTDEALSEKIARIKEGTTAPTSFGQGWLEALEAEQQRRLSEKSVPAEDLETAEDDGFIPIDPALTPNYDEVMAEFADEREKAAAGSGADGEGLSNSDNSDNSDKAIPDSAEGSGAAGTALSRIPVDEQTGEPMFEAAPDKETAWDGLVEKSGTEEKAAVVARAQVEQATEELEKLNKRQPQKKQSKLKGSVTAMLNAMDEADEAFNKKMEEYQAQVTEVQARLEMWRKIAGVQSERQAAERSRLEAEAAARAQAEEQARAERQERERQEREALNGVPEWAHDTPQNARARGYRRVAGEKIDRQMPTAADDKGLGREVEPMFKAGDHPVSAKGRVLVGEVESFQPSHLDGEMNPRHFGEEWQPKKRHEDGGVSSAAADKNARNLNTALVTRFEDAFGGAPVVNSRREGIQGNGRLQMFRYLYERYPEKGAAYKQYLIEHADELGVSPDYIASLERPIAAMMLDVDDARAKELGNIDDKEMTSGGIERIKPKNVVERLGQEMRDFATLLLRTSDDEASFGQLIDNNGAETLEWLNRKGVISNTQYQSCFDSKGRVTAEAVNDLKKVLYQSVFADGSKQLEEMFDRMPSKVQRAILATAFRDYDSPAEESMKGELQQSIAAFDALMHYQTFASATNREAAQRAIEDWKRQYVMDDVTGELSLPSEKFSNFALALAALYKGATQNHIQSVFNTMFDIVQGTSKDTLFATADKTPKTLAEAIKQVLGVEYQPITNKQHGKDGSPLLGSGTETGESGRRGSAGGAAGGERDALGAATPDSGRGAAGDGGAGGTAIENNVPEKKEVITADPRTMPDDEKARRGVMLRNAEAISVEKNIIVSDGELSARKVAEAWWDTNVGAPVFYETEAGEVEISKSSIKDSLSHGYNQAKLDALTSLSEGFKNAVYLGSLPDFGRPGVQNHYFAYPIFYDGERRYVFCRAMATNNKNKLYVHEVMTVDAINKSNALQTIASASKDGELHGGIALYKAILKNVLDSRQKENTDNSLPAVETSPATVDGKVQDTSEGGNLLSGNSSLSASSERKVTNSASEKQEKGGESLYTTEQLEAMSLDELGQLIADAEYAVTDSYDERINALEAEKQTLEGKWRRTPADGRRLKQIDSEVSELKKRKKEDSLAASKKYREIYTKKLKENKLSLSELIDEAGKGEGLSHADAQKSGAEGGETATQRQAQGEEKGAEVSLANAEVKALADKLLSTRGNGITIFEETTSADGTLRGLRIGSKKSCTVYWEDQLTGENGRLDLAESEKQLKEYERDHERNERLSKVRDISDFWEFLKSIGDANPERGVSGYDIKEWINQAKSALEAERYYREVFIPLLRILNGTKNEEAQATPLPPTGINEKIVNGYKRGDEVLWDREGNGKWERVKIEDFDNDGNPVFESANGEKPEKGDWSRVKAADGVFGEAKRVATQAQAERARRAKEDNQTAESKKREAINETEKKATSPQRQTPGADKQEAGQEKRETQEGVSRKQELEKKFEELAEVQQGEEADDGFSQVVDAKKVEAAEKALIEELESLSEAELDEIVVEATDGQSAVYDGISKQAYNFESAHRERFAALSEKLAKKKENLKCEDAWESGRDMAEVDAKKKPGKFKISEATDSKSHPGIHHIESDKLAAATSGALLVVTTGDYDAKLAGKIVDARGRELGGTAGLPWRRYSKGFPDHVMSLKGRDSARMTASLREMSKEEKATAKVVVALGRGEFMSFGASDWEKFLRAANSFGVKDIEFHKNVAIARGGNTGMAVVLRKSIDGSESAVIRHLMRSGVEIGSGMRKKHAAEERKEAQGGIKMTPEMERKAAKLRELLARKGTSGEAREPEALTQSDSEDIFNLGVDFARDIINQGVETFPDFAKQMTEVLGDAARPYLKSWYLGLRHLPEYVESGRAFTPTAEVERFDTANFDKAGYDPFADARMRAQEHQVRKRSELSEKSESSEDSLAERETGASDALIDEFCGRFNDYLDSAEGLSAEESARSDEAMAEEAARYRGELAEALMAEGMQESDAARVAREVLSRAMGEVQAARGLRARRAMIEPAEGEAYSKRTEEKPQEEERPGEKTYATASGDEIEFSGYGDLPALKPGEACYVERKFASTKEFGFTGTDKIESVDDVAYLFRELESYSTEHSFAVLVREGEPPLIMQLGMGSEAATIVSKTAIRAAYDAMGGAEKIYFVHNHPSGLMRPSLPDEALLRSLRGMFPEGVIERGIIMDTTSGEYCLFGEGARSETRKRRGEEGGKDYAVYRFSRHVFGKDYNPSDDMKATDDKAVAKIVSSQRLGQRDKMNLLLTSNSLQVTGSFVLPDTKDVTALAEATVSLATRFGGRRVVLYGNVPMGQKEYGRYAAEVKRLSGDEMSVLSQVYIENGLNSEEPRKPEEKKEAKEAETTTPQLFATPERKTAEIDDFGEKLEGARKDRLKEIAAAMDDVTEAALTERKLAEVFKRPNVKQMVERGDVTAEEARIVEAYALAISGDSKPVVGRSTRSKRAGGMTTRESQTMSAWAKRQHERIKALSAYLKASPEERREMEAKLGKALEETEALVNRATGLELTTLPTEALMAHILERSGLNGIEKLKPVKSDVYKIGAGSWRLKTSKSTYVSIGDTLEEAVDYMTALLMLKNGMAEAKLPRKLFGTKGFKYSHENTGRYEVIYTGKRGDLIMKKFETREEAEKFCEQFTSSSEYRLREEKRVGAATEIAITVTDPIKNEVLLLEERYGSYEEAAAALDEKFEEVNEKGVAAVLENNAIKRQEKEEFAVRHFLAGNGLPEVWAVTPARGTYLEIISEHATEAEALAAKEKKEAELRRLKEQRKTFNYFRPDAKRRGPDHRGGKDATPEMFGEAFGFRGVQFGNWTNQRDRQEALNQAYDGLMDLAAATGLPARALSLNGELGLAFGSRGSGSAMAHYEPTTVVINLTKTRGSGSLAHEWWHALDNYFGRHSQVKGGYATEGMTKGIRNATAAAFGELSRAVKESAYAARSAKRGAYWGSMRELTARLFAEWVDKGRASRGEHSPFLARGVDEALVEQYKELNWLTYKASVAQKRRNGIRTPKVMTREEFMSSPDALDGFVDVTAEELKELGAHLDKLFEEMEIEERDGHTAVFEPAATYGGEENDMGKKFVAGREEEAVARRRSEATTRRQTSGDGNKYRDGAEMSDGERMRAIRALEPIEVKPNDMSRAELREVFNNLPSVEKDGREIEFYRSSFKKIYKEGGLFGQVVPVLDEVLGHSVLAYSERDNLGGMVRPDGTVHKTHSDVISFDNYVGKVNIEGKEYYIRTTVQRGYDGRNGTHSFFVTGVDIYEKTAGLNSSPGYPRATEASGKQSANSLSLPITSRARGTADGIVDAKLQQFFERASAEATKLDMRERVEELSEKLNTPVRVITDESELSEVSEDGKPRYNRRERRAKGWWDGRTGEVVVVLPNHVDVADVENTVVHELVGHKGLRAFIGEERFDAFLDEVYGHADAPIREVIDKMTDRMVNAEAERLREEKRKAHEEAGENPNSTHYTDMAEARVDAEKKREAYRREAAEEYMADLGGRIGDEGFEKMSSEELTFWGAIKAKVQQFLDRFLRGLKIAKSVRLTDKDLSYILFKSWKHAKEKKAGHGDVFMEAKGELRRRGTRFVETSRDADWKVKAQVLTETKKSPEGKTIAPADSRSHAEAPRYVPSLPKISDAKVATISENLKLLEENIPENGLGKNQIIFEIAQRIKMKGDSSKSNYSVVNVPGVGVTTIRVSNHSANPSNFGITDNNVGVIIKTSNQYFREKDDVDYVEFMYYGDKVSGDGALQKAIVRGLRHYIETGDFGQMPEPDRLNTSGAYQRAIDGIGERMRYRDPGMGLEETITKMKAEAMQANADNLQAKKEAMRAIGGNLNHLRQAMARQREYDITTVKSVTDLARVLMENGLLDTLGRGELKRLLGAINSVVGKKDVSKYVQKVMDVMVGNQLRMAEQAFGKLMSIKGSRVDARGIEVQGQLDPDGQKIAQVVKKFTSATKENIDARIAEAEARMNNADKTIAEEAALERAGLEIARRYAEKYSDSKAEERDLRDSIKAAKEEKDAGQMSAEVYKQYVEATEDAIRQNRIERIESLHEIIDMFGGTLKESVERAKAWREAEKQRIREIHHNANSDMEGRTARSWSSDMNKMKDKVLNFAARTIISPLGTFEQMLKMFGGKSSRGEGYLYQRFMRQLMEALDTEWKGYSGGIAELDAKASEVFGKKMKWTDLYKVENKLPKGKIKAMDNGEEFELEMKQGNLLYIYMVDKMSDGRMKLRRMGITEETVAEIAAFLDPRLKELGDWLQEEFLVGKRNKYNEVYKRMYGASMSAIENYFPLRVHKGSIDNDPEQEKANGQTTKSAETTGAWKKRTRNGKPLDIMNANAISVIVEHLKEMEHANAFAEFARDLNTLRKYKRFESQVKNIRSAYGSGATLWRRFEEACSMATGDYKPETTEIDKGMMEVSKFVTAAKIAFRVFTAFKQLASFPSFLADCRLDDFLYTGRNLLGSWRWAMENMPNFEKRWKSRIAGDPILKRMENERNGLWKMLRSGLGRYGMAANAFVDGLTVAIGARAIYRTKKRKYKRWGLTEEEAERRAIGDAEILFNLSQQSSEGAFLSTIQASGSWTSALWTVFRNASMSYTRQVYDACRNLTHRFKPGYKEQSIEFMRKQMVRAGVEEGRAKKEAEREYATGWMRDLARVVIYGYVNPTMWYLFGKIPYLLLGSNEEEKEEIVKDSCMHGFFGPVEGIVGGDIISDALNAARNGEFNYNGMRKEMPLVQDVENVLKNFEKDQVAAMNDMVNLLVQAGLGVNPETLENAVIAGIDFVQHGDPSDMREYGFLIARIANCPQSQLEEAYFDEIGASGEEASKMAPEEIAERYAEYKKMRKSAMTGWMYSPEEREEALERYRKQARTSMKERLEAESLKQTKAILERYEEASAAERELNKLRDVDRDLYLSRREALWDYYGYDWFNRVKLYKHNMQGLTRKWLRAKTPEEAMRIRVEMENERLLMMYETR